MTLSIALPLVRMAGFDPIWSGIFIVLMVELSQIAPPVRCNLFVIQGLTSDSIGDIAKAAFPIIATYLPAVMLGE